MFFWMIGIVLFASVIAFIVIARKGRKLRTMRVLPGEATNAVVESDRGRRYKIDSQTHFYFGKNPECQVIVNTASDYAVCIFHHRRRFAFETLSNARGIQVNGEEQMAGYLTNGDVLEIAGEKFIFTCL